jgi:3-oxoacyl-[acyl-carrier protein] reductase
MNANNTLPLKGKITVVTGASRGIGKSIAIELAKQGAFVWVNYSSNSAYAEEVVALCKQAGGDAASLQWNIASSEEVDAAFDKIKERHGKVDVLVNNAGISRDGLFVRMKNEDWDATLAVNLNGAFYCSRAAARFMMKNRWGRIINISSVVGEMGNAGQAAYSASKAGLLGLTKSLARELGSRNITVNAITPGFIETDMTAVLPEALKEEHQKGIALGRFGKADEIAPVVAFLATDAAGYITGQVIGVNGGMYM